ncbi:hypothetical protein KFE25_008940 [Diacronema lutheri]|uniref:tRNA pseudouridine synthase n=2 Tax=Diacronema lutheri TaxID=2081491 RepID=A0A8J5XTY5_DIALT|nr:hypothetical protein KFE25_008940 [Diacronema lutheri]
MADTHVDAGEDLSGLSREELIDRVVGLRRELRAASMTAASAVCAAPPAAPRAGLGSAKAEKRRRAFDFSKYYERHIALKVAYDGRTYDGLAALQESDNTVEGQLYVALEKTCLIRSRSECRFSKAGRTDKGVSSSGQVVALYVRSNRRVGEAPWADDSAELDYAARLNCVLPPEIRVLAWAPVDDAFDARFSAKYRVYRYYFLRGSLDLARMRQAASAFVGMHDMRNFCKADTEKVHSFVRTLTNFDVTPVAGPFAADAPDDACGHDARLQLCAFTIKGRAFLWHQVRCMVSVLFLVGRGLEPPEVVSRLLDVEAQPGKPQYSMASELPLVLQEIGYEPSIAWHCATPPTQALASSALKTFCDTSINLAYVSTLLAAVTGAAPSEQWWPAMGHMPGGGDRYSNSKVSRGGESLYIPLLRRSRNPPLVLRSLAELRAGRGGRAAEQPGQRVNEMDENE